MEIKTYGDKELIRELKELQGGILEDKVHEALVEGTNIVKNTAQSRAPRRTGQLAESIRSQVRKLRGKVFCDYPKTNKLRKNKTAKQAAGSKDYYAFAVEYGTKNMKAQPFLSPAVQSSKKQIEELIQQAMGKAIKK